MQLLAVAFTAILAIVAVVNIYRRKKGGRLPPGPPTLPIIGNLHQLFLSRSPLHVNMSELAKVYGDLMTVKIGCVRTLVVSSARMAREVLKTHDLAFSGRPLRAAIRKFSHNYSDIIFASYGPYWREIRKIGVLQLFSAKKVQSFASIRREEVAVMIGDLYSHCNAAQQPVDLSHLIHSYSNNIIFRIAFGKRFDDQLHGSRVSAMCKDIQEVSVRFCFEDYFPPIALLDELTGLRSLVRRNFKDTYSFIQEVIDEHRAHQSSAEAQGLVDVLIRLRNQNTAITHDYQIHAILADVLVAGTDTSSATLVWIMTELMRNPRVMNKLQEEVRTTIGPKVENKLVPVREEDIEKLPYMKAVIKETLRLDPATPLMVPRQVIQGCVVDGREISPGMELCVNVWAIGRDPDVWDRPEEFWPERFLNTDIDVMGPDFVLLPFGGGRRRCPGMLMGISTVEIALANLIYSFDWKVPPGTPDVISMDTLPGTVLQKKTPLRLIVTKHAAPAT